MSKDNEKKWLRGVTAGASLAMDIARQNLSEQASESSAYPAPTMPYVESETVSAAKKALAEQETRYPGRYESKYHNQLSDLWNDILGRKPFSYDINSDALYEQYKDQYIRGGRLAMQDVMGQAQSMTGGYGNSYAQTAGNEAYLSYLSELNNIVPELHERAYARYQDEEEALYNRYALLQEEERLDYERYRDKLSDYLTERNYLADRYDAERDADYAKYADNRDFAYAQQRDEAADEKWQAEYQAATAPVETSSDGVMNAEETAQWRSMVMAADTEEEMMSLCGVLYLKSPEFAMNLAEEWRKEHGLPIDTIDTTVE